jgi:shikimate kinase
LELEQNIFLVGMPSSGKSTLGKQLASQLGYTYVDMDEVLIQNEGRSISQIFQESGENYFRAIERDLLLHFGPNQSLVISTGGGAPCFYDNMAFIKANGISIYLDVKPDILFERIHQSAKNDRPLIDKSDNEKLRLSLDEKYKNRYQFYSKADIIIKDTFTVSNLMKKLKSIKKA